MFDPFRRARAKSRKKIVTKTVSTITDTWAAVLTPAKPAKRPARKPKEPAARSKKSPPVARKRDGSAVKPHVRATSHAKLAIPRGAEFRAGSYESPFGTRSYQLYVPRSAKSSSKPLPMLVMLHGCGQTPRDFARGTGMNALAEEFGFYVLYPAQPRRSHINRCWNWFQRSDQERDAGEPALLSGLTQRIIAEKNVDPAKVYVAGLSAGASAALILATAYPDIFAAVGVHSGLAVGAAHDAASAARAMQFGATGQRHRVKMPTIIFHGDADKVANPRNGRFVAIRALEPFTNLDQKEVRGRVAGGRDYVRVSHRIGSGRSYTEHWLVLGSGHAWSGGNPAGSYTDPNGPDASRQMVRFFLRHRTTKTRRLLGT